jgi:hypothetical protein
MPRSRSQSTGGGVSGVSVTFLVGEVKWKSAGDDGT